VQYLDDLIGSLQCPSCGEEILQGRAAPEHREDQPAPGVPLLGPFEEDEPEDPDAPQKVQEKRPERHREERRSRYADEPNLHDPMTQPRGVRGAGITWYACGIIGLVVNGLFLLFFWGLLAYAKIVIGRPLPMILLLPVVGFTVGTLLFYAGLIWIGARLRAGTWQYLQVPAGFVLISALTLLVANVSVATESASELIALSAPDVAPRLPSSGPFFVLVVSLFWFVPCAVLDLFLIRASQILLWQATKHAHWFNAGNVKPRPAPLEERTPYPALIGLAGFLWLLFGLVVIGSNLWMGAQYIVANAPDRTDTRATILLSLGGGVVVALLTAFYLGVLLLGSRLPSTLPAGIAFLILSLLSVCFMAYAFTQLDALLEIGIPVSTELRNWLQFMLTVQLVLTCVPLVASIACIIGDSAYRSWLRTWRGFRV
jgi:hypothetical protein